MSDPLEIHDAPILVDRLLADAAARRASDAHIDPESDGFVVRYRVDGLLEEVERFDTASGRAVVARLMVMAKLLTYRRDIPQEGKLAAVVNADLDRPVEMRLSVMPTTHGLRAVVRLPAELDQPRDLEALGLGASVVDMLRRFADADAGMLLLTGPAGSGKTTTIYALLEHLRAAHPGVSIVTLEDPVERDLPGVTQIQVAPHGELTYERALRSILRQDPQVLVLGEVRDAATASIAVQAALTGHRLVATLHAGSCAGAITRFMEMGVEPYQITSAVSCVVAQRLLRRADGEGAYTGRTAIASGATMDPKLSKAILNSVDSAALDAILAEQPSHRTLRESAQDSVNQGLTDQNEVARVLGSN